MDVPKRCLRRRLGASCLHVKERAEAQDSSSRQDYAYLGYKYAKPVCEREIAMEENIAHSRTLEPENNFESINRGRNESSDP